jgi:uncharacterized protein (TIRG00374 family)
LGLGILAGLLFYLDIGQIGAVMRRVNWALAVPAIIGLSAMHLVGAAMWKYLCRRLSGIRFNWGYATKAYYASQTAGSITPSNIGADVYRVYSLTGGEHQWQEGIAPIVVQRIASYLGLLMLGTCAAWFIPISGIAGKALAVPAILLFISLVSLWLLRRTASTQGSLVNRLVNKLRLPVSWVEISSKQFYTSVTAAALMAFVFHAGSVGLTYLLVLSIGGDFAILTTISVLALARLALLFPFSIGGLGFQEGALALLFPLVGMSAEMGLSVSLLSRVGLLLTAAIGAAVILIGRMRTHQQRPASEHTPAQEDSKQVTYETEASQYRN